MEAVKLPLNYGTMAGIALFAAFLLFYYTGFNPLGNISWLVAWVPVLFIVNGIRAYRDEYSEGYIKYGKALTTGLFITFIYASLFALLIYLFGSYINSGFLDLYLADAYAAMETAKKFLSAEMHSQAVEQLDNTTIALLAMQDFHNKILGGLVISLITAAFLKRKPLPQESLEHE